ncbi:helix-turn-helix transcriptional regulator [Clostridium sp. Marseille-P2415]|uniref:helix-turn-helix transcriptional regulator n=1 Tax=Clostridium sp. Marseille-P2415 TaxID=1805471 RepID=UPI0009887D0F|nr:helix-turn-helix transcriptional regulator [Clostridium sp. Marseille-P2415]
MNENFSKNLLLLRKKVSLSQCEVAKELGISRQTLSKWETGKSTPDATYIKKISEIYKISIDELLGVENDGDHVEKEENIFQSNKVRKKNYLVLLFVVVDILLSIVLICISKHMFFWVMDFNLILLAIYIVVRLMYFIKAIVN